MKSLGFDRFEINLANRRGDVLLHVNPRLNDHQLVLNAAPGGGWGAEERKPLAITRGTPFSIIIMVAEHGYKVGQILHQISKKTASNFRLRSTINMLLIFTTDCPSMLLI